MNQPEFNQWWTDFKLRFPDMGGPWFAEGRTADTQKMILGTWANLMHDVTLAESLAVNRGMQSGDLESFGGKWDRDRIPAIVRNHASAQRPSSTWSGPNDDSFPQPRDTLPVKLGGVLRELIDMQEKNIPAADCAEWLRRQFPQAAPYDQRAYKCIQCLDCGRVEVWHWEAVAMARRDGIESVGECKYKTAAAACTCKLGNVFANRKIPLTRYDPMKHCRAFHADVTSEAALKNLGDWLADQVTGKGKANYEPAFLEYRA